MKKIVLLLLIMLRIFSYSQDIEDGLLLYYPFSGDASDASGNNYHGITNATLTEDRFGNPESAYSFNGIDQYIDLPNVPELEPELPISISFWVKFDDFDVTKSTIFTTDFAQNNHSGIWANIKPEGYLAVSYGDASGNTTPANRRTKIGTTLLNTNEWYQIILIIRGATDMSIYIDCIEDNGNYFGTGGDLGYTPNPGSIGRKDAHTSNPPYYFKGSVDDFRYWEREITPSEVDYICNSLSIDESLTTYTDCISVYPNPTENKLFIEKEDTIEIEKVVIHSILGGIVYKDKMKSNIEVKNLKSGIYYIQFYNKEGFLIETKKFIKL